MCVRACVHVCGGDDGVCVWGGGDGELCVRVFGHR